jgi:ribonuclease HI
VSLPSDSIIIFCDGACSGNPGRGGWGAIVALPTGEVKELGGASPLTTNNKMELTAAIEALRYIESHPLPTTLCTDSTYVIKGVTQWITGWKIRGWKTSTGEPVANRDLWEALHALASQRAKKVVWRYVKGHAGIVGNERADEIAVGQCAGKSPALFSGNVTDYPYAFRTLDEGKASAKSNGNGNGHGKGKVAHSYLSVVDNVPMRHASWKDCEKRVKGASGAKYKKSISVTDEKEILKSWGFKSTDLL